MAVTGVAELMVVECEKALKERAPSACETSRAVAGGAPWKDGCDKAPWPKAMSTAWATLFGKSNRSNARQLNTWRAELQQRLKKLNEIGEMFDAAGAPAATITAAQGVAKNSAMTVV